jgi:D-alanyl-D-alanine carboxypeptidase (penicillin-binding protein 5/6)
MRPRGSVKTSFPILALVAVATLLFLLLPPGQTLAAPSPGVPAVTAGPVFPQGDPQPPKITCKAAILIDADTGEILYSHNANARLPMASTTKIMTAIVALETLDPKQKVTVSANAASEIGSVASLAKGEVLTVEDLLRAMLIPSGNDAAVALAEASAGSVSAFVAKMNAKAKTLGLTNTHFVNANGLNVAKHFSSAKDLATMTQYAMSFPLFRRIVATKGLSLPTLPGQKPRRFVSKNELLQKYDWVTGVKTGSTPAAGSCVVSAGTREGVSLIAVVLGAKDSDTRWKEAANLLLYGFSLYPRTILVSAGQPVLWLRPADPAGRPIPVVAESPLSSRVFESEQATGAIHLTSSGLSRVTPGEVLGRIDFTIRGRYVGSSQLLAAERSPLETLTKALDRWRSFSSASLVFEPST